METTGEQTNDIYYQKYLKYKTKYLELKKQTGGACGSVCYSSRNRTHSYMAGRCIFCRCRK